MNKIAKKIKTAWSTLSEEGMLAFLYKFRCIYYPAINVRKNDDTKYRTWIKKNEKDINKREELSYEPLISVVIPVYNVSENMLRMCIDSVRKQTYKNWELCLADDASTMPEVKKCLAQYEGKDKIKIKYREKNGHISACTNTAISMAQGEYIAFMDCDDVLAPNALYEVAKLLNDDRELDFIYSDEDKMSEDGKKRHQPHFKPDWSPDTMMSLMYTCHLGVYRKRIGDELGWLREGFEGAQDYDFTLRFTEKTDKIGHVPKILYHWRERKESTAINPEAKEYVKEATRKAKEEALERRGIQGEVEWVDGIYQYRVNYIPPKDTLVSIVIPSKDNFEIYKRCVDSILEKTKDIAYEVVTVDNGSSEENRKKYAEYAQKNSINYIYHPMEFNYSKMCNMGVKEAKGNMILLLNDDIEALDGKWMLRMAGHAALKNTGAVGAKLYYPDSKLIQHIGVVSLEAGPSHSFGQMEDEPVYYFCRNKIEYNYSAVTAACLMVEKRKYLEVGGLDETFAVAYNDVDFCYKLTEKGYYNVSRMDAVLYHYESLSRGSDVIDPEKYDRLMKERGRLYKKHPQYLRKDCYYSPNLTMYRADCSLNLGNEAEHDTNKVKELAGIKDVTDSGKASISLEKILVQKNVIMIWGWCVLKDVRYNNLHPVKVILEGRDKVYCVDTSRIYREKMDRLSGVDAKCNLSSFCMSLKTEDIVEGEYQVYLMKKGQLFHTGKTVRK